MSSDEVINQIIRSIVQSSTSILKKELEEAVPVAAPVETGETGDESAAKKEAPETSKTEQPAEKPAESARSINGIFLAGIQSHVKPFQVTDTLAAFMIRAVVLNPSHGFNVEKEMARSEVDRLVKLCVDMITKKDDPEMETIRAQVYFDTNFPSQGTGCPLTVDEFLQKERRSRLEQCATLLREIVEMKPKGMNTFDPLNRKIVSYVLLRSNVGIPTDVRVIREATAALESVFPVSELTSFMALSRSDKEAQLNGLTNLVTGIRLFNKDLGKGGETIEPIPEYCNRELRELMLLIHNQTKDTEDKIQLYKAILDYKDQTINAELSDEAAENVRLGLVFQRQYLVYLDALR
ncbi:hypothetical protein HDU91_007192, partial [Kappamyces sp. JEL0680]